MLKKRLLIIRPKLQREKAEPIIDPEFEDEKIYDADQADDELVIPLTTAEKAESWAEKLNEEDQLSLKNTSK